MDLIERGSGSESLLASDRSAAGCELQTTLLELVNLSLVGKQYHWSVVGPHFGSLHRQLDDFVDAWRELADTVAERAVAIGFWPNGQAEVVAAETGWPGLEVGPIADKVVVRTLGCQLAEVAENVRARVERLGALDPASQDVLVEVVRTLEQQLWMTRAQLDGQED